MIWAPPTSRKAVLNPRTGKYETVTDHDSSEVQRKLEQTRRELRDMLSGNTQFHVDPHAKPADPPAEPEEDDCYDGLCMCGDSIDHSPWLHGHTPVPMREYYARQSGPGDIADALGYALQALGVYAEAKLLKPIRFLPTIRIKGRK